MDTSNKKLNETNDIHMDIANYLLKPNDKKIPLKDISSEKCVEIFRSLVEESRQYLRYFSSHFKEIKEVISKVPHWSDLDINKQVIYDTSIGYKTRIMRVFDSYRELQYLHEEVSKGHVVSLDVYIADNGELLVLVEEFGDQIIGREVYSVFLKTKFLHFKIIDDKALTLFIERNKRFFKALLFSFINTMSKVIEEREDRTNRLKENLNLFERVDKLITV